MESLSAILQAELLCVVVNYGLGNKVVKISRQNGISGDTILLGRGTVKNHILELLDINDIKKEIVFLIGDENKVANTIEDLNTKLELKRPNHGIAFTCSINKYFGSRNYKNDMAEGIRGVKMNKYDAIFVIVDKGMSGAVLEAASKAGSRGGTVINARGSGLHETQKLFSMAIEPEKEIVMILSESGFTEPIADSIRNLLKIDEPGNGIMFIIDVNKTYGLF